MRGVPWRRKRARTEWFRFGPSNTEELQRLGGKVRLSAVWIPAPWYAFGRRPRPGFVIDHINGNARDNRPENLQEISASANTMKDAVRVGAMGYRNVHQYMSGGRPTGVFQARVRVLGRTILCKTGKDPEVLARTVDDVLRALNIRGMRYNFPRSGEYGLDRKVRR